MLIFMIRNGQSFEIGNQVKIKIIGIRGNQVRVAVDAPKSISVHRKAIADRIRAENGGVIPSKEVE